MIINTSSGGSKTKALSYLRDTPADSSIPVTLEGELHLKITFIDGKRSPDRSWRLVSAEVRGNRLKMTLHREGKSNQSPEPSGIIDLRSFHVTEGNYTKRKHVFKLTSAPLPITSTSSSSTTNVTSPSSLPQSSSTSAIVAGTELLIQADSHQEMKLWMDTLRKASCMESASSVEYLPKFSTQTNETQHLSVTQTQQSTSSSGEIPPSKSVRKYLGSRSPSGQSPVTKSRKTPQLPNISTGSKDSSDKEIGSPKSRTWKGLVARQFRKIQGQTPSSPNANFGQLPEGASIGVPLIQCTPSEENEYVPFLVVRCTQIVESRGLGVVGIYRIPGNTAAITALTEQVNRGFDEQTLSDPRWEDVNVVSSLLKLFIRSLPDGLLPNDLYSSFIEADKETGQDRLTELKILIGRLPPHSSETLKHLMRHLNLVSRNCDTNLMEPKNLAIIFGPSVVRTSNETLETVVKDMKHQCRIVELFVSHYDYFFENGPMPVITDIPDYSSVSPPEMQTHLLLDNVAKIEPIKEHRESARFVSKFVQAATSRKTRKNTHRKSTISTLTPDTISLDSSTSAESKEHQKLTHSIHRSSGNDDMLKNRLSEDETNDGGAFADNGSMSLTTVTLALDDKLRSLRNSTFEPDEKSDSINETDANGNTNAVSSKSSSITITTTTTTNIKNQIIDRLQPLTLGGENIPYADESPERPLIQSVRTKPLRVQTYSIPSTTRYTTTRLYSQSSTSPNTSPTDVLSSSQSHSSQENVAVSIPVPVPVVKAPSSVSSDDTDTSTTSNPLEKCPSTIRIDREMIREMNRILTTLERKATKLNRSLSLNYKNHKGECCCNGSALNMNLNNNHVSNNNNSNATNNNYRSMSNNRFSLTKDEKTDKNINKKRQIQDIKNRRYANRSIKRRHTVGGTHDYGSTKTAAGEQRCQQEGHIITRNGQIGDIGVGDAYIISTRTSSPDLTKDNQTLNDSKVNEN